jgi:hypothetical protein
LQGQRSGNKKSAWRKASNVPGFNHEEDDMNIRNASLVAAIVACLCTQAGAQLPTGPIRIPTSVPPSNSVIHNRTKASVGFESVKGVMTFQTRNINPTLVNISTLHSPSTL